MHEGCWALELAQGSSLALVFRKADVATGWIPGMLPFAFADLLFSTLDWETCYHTVRITGREMIRNLLRGKL